MGRVDDLLGIIPNLDDAQRVKLEKAINTYILIINAFEVAPNQFGYGNLSEQKEKASNKFFSMIEELNLERGLLSRFRSNLFLINPGANYIFNSLSESEELDRATFIVTEAYRLLGEEVDVLRLEALKGIVNDSEKIDELVSKCILEIVFPGGIES